MRLPLPDYASPTPSRGYEDPHGPMAVAGAAAASAGARGHLVAALGSVAGIAEAWAEAEDKASATKAYADYHARMSQVHTDLTKNPTIAVGALPENIKYNKERMEPDPDNPGQSRPRTTVPMWEVSDQLFDHYAKENAAALKPEARSLQSKRWLDQRIQESNTTIGAQVAAQSLTGRKNQMHADYESAIQDATNSGMTVGIKQKDGTVKQELAAPFMIDDMVRQGLISPVDAVKRKQKAQNDAANLQVARLVIETDDPVKLEVLGDELLYNKGYLTDEQAIAQSKAALAKAERITKARDKEADKEAKKESSIALTDFVSGIRLGKRLPSKAEVSLAISRMTPEDARSALALYDRKDGSEGASNDAVKKSLTNRLIGSMAPGVGASMDERVRSFRSETDRQYSLGTLSEKDWRQFHSDAKNMTDRVTTDDPNYKLATEAVYANIAKNPKGTLLSSSGSESRYAVAVEMEIGLFNAKMAKPDLDPVKWVTDNQAKYQTKADKAITDKLRKAGLTAYIGTDAAVGYDPYKTEDLLRKAYRSKAITNELYVRGMNLVLEKPPIAEPATPK